MIAGGLLGCDRRPPPPPRSALVLSQDVKIQPAWLYYRGVPFTLPYVRNDVSLLVEDKTPSPAGFNLRVVDPEDWQKVDKGFMYVEFQCYTEFLADRVSRFSKRGTLPGGDYVLMLRGCGTLAEPAVSVRIEATELP